MNKKAFVYIEGCETSLKTEYQFDRICELFPENLYAELLVKGDLITLSAGCEESIDVKTIRAGVSNPDRVRALIAGWLMDAVPFIPSTADAEAILDLTERHDVVCINCDADSPF